MVVKLFRELVPIEQCRLLFPCGSDLGVLAFFSLADVLPTGAGAAQSDEVGFSLERRGSLFMVHAEVADGCSGPVRSLFTIRVELNPGAQFHVAKQVGLVKVRYPLRVGHTLTIIEQSFHDHYGQWLTQIALPAILKYCLDADRLFVDPAEEISVAGNEL